MRSSWRVGSVPWARSPQDELPRAPSRPRRTDRSAVLARSGSSRRSCPADRSTAHDGAQRCLQPRPQRALPAEGTQMIVRFFFLVESAARRASATRLIQDLLSDFGRRSVLAVPGLHGPRCGSTRRGGRAGPRTTEPRSYAAPPRSSRRAVVGHPRDRRHQPLRRKVRHREQVGRDAANHGLARNRRLLFTGGRHRRKPVAVVVLHGGEDIWEWGRCTKLVETYF